MKKVVSTIIAASLMLAGVNAFAQISVGAGYLNSTYTTKYGDNKNSTNLNGAYVGAFYNVPLSGNFSVEPGLYVSYLGKKMTSDSYFGVSASTTRNEFALNVPINFKYNYAMAPDMAIFAYAGPTVYCGLSAKTSGAVTYLGTTTSNLYEGNMGRFDILLGGGLGFEVSRFVITAGYKYGLINRYTGSNSANYKVHRGQLNLGVAYKF